MSELQDIHRTLCSTKRGLFGLVAVVEQARHFMLVKAKN